MVHRFHRRRFLTASAAASLTTGVPLRAFEPAEKPLWKRTEPDFAIYLPTGDHDGTNQMVNCVETAQGTWIVTFTMASREGAADQRVVVTRSTDRGKTWSPPQVLGGSATGDKSRASWIIPFVAKPLNRVYVFYNQNTGQQQVRSDITGEFHVLYSDDDGKSWNDAGRLKLPMGEFGHPDSKADPNWIGLYSPLVTAEDEVLFPFARYKAGPHLKRDRSWPYQNWQTECCLMRFDNILTEKDATQLTITVLPEGEQGVRVRHPKIAGGSWANEPSVTQLSDGRLLMVMRTRIDAVWWSASEDGGRTWTDPAPLRNAAGKVMQNPNAPVFLTRLPDGRMPLIYFNAPGGSTFGPRDPAFISVGVEALDRNPPVAFTPPKQLMTVNNTMPPAATSYPQIAAYGSFFQSHNNLYLIYPDCKHFILGKRLMEEMLPNA